MLPLFLFTLAVIFAICHFTIKRERSKWVEIFLSYLIFFNIGMMGLLSFLGHVFISDEIAKDIGWPLRNLFQLEIAFANLAFGIIGILGLRFRGLFWLATIIGNSTFLFGVFAIHEIYYLNDNIVPLNSGISVWFGDLFLPCLYLILLGFYLRQHRFNC